MKNNNLTTILTITFSLLLFFSCKKEECAYNEGDSFSIPCEEICNTIEDFEETAIGTLGNWVGENAVNASIILQDNSNVLFAQNSIDVSWLYNQTDFPADLHSLGCELQYDVQYIAGITNPTTTAISVTVFQGGPPPAPFTNSAVFILNSSNLITSGDPMKTIVVPLELALTTGTTLPSNAYGEWSMSGTTGTSYTPAQITVFNSLMQSNNGIGFSLDEGQGSNNRWYYDNFCITTCCSSNLPM